MQTLTEQLQKANEELSDYIILKTYTATETVTINANSGLSVSSYLPSYTAPEGYKELISFVHVTGQASVVSVGTNTSWVYNTSSSEKTVTPIRNVLFIRDV